MRMNKCECAGMTHENGERMDMNEEHDELLYSSDERIWHNHL